MCMQRDEPPAERYQRLLIDCDLSISSLEDAVLRAGARPPVYQITVSPTLSVVAKRIVAEQGITTKENPLAPALNLVIDDTLERGEWYITVNGRSVGSKGVW